MTTPYTPPAIQINTRKCTLCGACADICLGGAIDIDRGAVIFNEYRCIICENCHDFYHGEDCPTGAFSIKDE